MVSTIFFLFVKGREWRHCLLDFIIIIIAYWIPYKNNNHVFMMRRDGWVIVKWCMPFHYFSWKSFLYWQLEHVRQIVNYFWRCHFEKWYYFILQFFKISIKKNMKKLHLKFSAFKKYIILCQGHQGIIIIYHTCYSYLYFIFWDFVHLIIQWTG